MIGPDEDSNRSNLDSAAVALTKIQDTYRHHKWKIIALFLMSLTSGALSQHNYAWALLSLLSLLVLIYLLWKIPAQIAEMTKARDDYDKAKTEFRNTYRKG